jgi:lipopolysaccharide/colanic/teichoic acid biosynthesis glycosyltransferase
VNAKRLLDIVAASLGLLLLSPLFGVLALAIELDSHGPVFYRASRVGKDGHPLRLYKFRTMITGADRIGPEITTAADARITRVGGLLRKSKLDELPQLINVLKGEMSLVGPRPEDPRFVALYTEEQRRVLSVPPGITSPASLNYKDEAALLTEPDWEQQYVRVIMQDKLAIELEYLSRRTLCSDILLVVRTIFG